LNGTMDNFVQLYAEELLPVAIQLTTRLVCLSWSREYSL
jgi:hypothetical protein